MDIESYDTPLERNQRWLRFCFWVVAVSTLIYAFWSVFVFVPEDCSGLIQGHEKMICRLAHYGDTRSQVELAQMYRNGNSLPVDYEKALGWLKKASESDSYEAHYLLGLMYDEGQGVPANTAHANRWFEQASKIDPQSFFDQVIYELYYINKDRGERLMILLANQGHAEVQFSLGLMYLDGPLDFDAQQARLWLEKAADTGHQHALGVLSDLNDQPHQPFRNQIPIWI